MTPLHASDPAGLALLAGIGLVAGTINTIAGGGSLITLPALIFLGLPPAVANATNRVGVQLQSLVATVSFARSGALSLGGGMSPDGAVSLGGTMRLGGVFPRLVAACLGALVGAGLSVSLDPELFRKLIGVAMLVILGILVAQPKRFLKPRPAAPLWAQLIGFFVIGGYGGFLQAGVGIFLLAGSSLLAGEDLVRGNATKNLMVAAFTLPALALFLAEGLVEPGPGLALASGAMVGGWLGAKLSLVLGAGFVRIVLALVVAISSSRLLGLW